MEYWSNGDSRTPPPNFLPTLQHSNTPTPELPSISSIKKAHSLLKYRYALCAYRYAVGSVYKHLLVFIH